MVKGKKIVIKLPNNLTPNTTYSINFGSAIEDITEYNTFPNYKYVFSTGDFLDSLSYTGTVVNAYDLTPQEKVYVLLYDKINDSIPLLELPRYVALTDKEGNYEITNIAEGSYKLFALKDINSNYLFDLPNEEIGFKDELISLTTSLKENKIELFEENHERQYIKKVSHKKYGKIDIQLNLPITDLKVKSLNIIQEHPWLIEKNEAGDSLIVWATFANKIKNWNIVIYDGETIIDTIILDLIMELKDSILSFSSNVTPAFNLNSSITITAERPVIRLDTTQIQLMEDSTFVDFKIMKKDEVSRKFRIEYPFKENTSYQLFIPPNTFEDIYGLKNDTLLQTFRTKSESDYGIINLSINPNFSKNYIVQLFRGEKLIKQTEYSGTQKIKYEYLNPGDYKLKLIVDNNNNKKWDTGNYLEHLQPEKVIYYEKEIKIRANWDNDIIWTIIK
jgi:hypothetical protein